MHGLVIIIATLVVCSTLIHAAITEIHAEGTCAMYKNCGKKSFFGAELPCPYNGPAVLLDSEGSADLIDICGPHWGNTPVCCDVIQLENLRQNLRKADTLISSCPACQANFVEFFCSFSCSPNQSQFVNITSLGSATSGNDIVTELDFFVSADVAEQFYNSCKDVKFSATNGFVMDLIGGGAQNYQSFLKFLGDEKPLLGGSPFQINFPWNETEESIERLQFETRNCADIDERYRCACVDCPGSCPALPPTSNDRLCKVGAMPCFSLAIITLYVMVLVVVILVYKSIIQFRNGPFYKPERLRLLHDAGGASEDEEEGDIVESSELVEGDLMPTYYLHSILQSKFTTMALFCAQFPGLVIGLSLLITGILSLGWLHFTIETNPIRLWVSSNSPSYQEKLFYDENFGPFYRAEQAFLVSESGPVLSYETLQWWFEVETNVTRIKSAIYGTTFDDICLKPTGEACVVQSITQYFGGDFDNVDESNWQEQIELCTANPVDCLPPFQQPLKPNMILGGVNGSYVDAQAIIISWVGNNDVEGSTHVLHAMDWEVALETFLLDIQAQAAERGLRLSFNTEISLEKELNKSTNTDAKIVVISYIIMFIYASYALGKISFKSGMRSLVDSKFTLGLFGIFIVLSSVSASVGLFSIIGIPITLIIAEVIPFLVLAVGVDNIFLLSHELQLVNQQYPNEPAEHRIARTMGKMGPSILLSASCETIAFALGAVVSMPAVRNFAIYAAGAVFIDAILQVTMFVSALTLDLKRTEDSRVDCFPFMKIQLRRPANNEDTPLVEWIRTKYAPTILKREVKVTILMVFTGFCALSLALIPNMKLGLDQRIAIPRDSYLVNYFDDLYDYFDSGPPVYFVTKEFNVSERAEQQALCGRFSTCNEYSLLNILEQERKRPEISYLSEPAASWIDDFFHWLNPQLDECCRFRKGSTEEMCPPYAREWQCDVCYANREPSWNITMNGLPEGDEFMKFFSFWIQSPSDPCPLGGQAPYSNAVVADYERLTFNATSFRTSHTPLRSQDDFINAYAAAKRISETISRDTGAEVFPYSVFYIFFEQYGSIFRLTSGLIVTAEAAIFVISALLLGSISTALVVTATVAMIVIDIMGIMVLWGISLNGVSLVNLVICVGIGVEFCCHLARAFMVPSSDVLDISRSRMKGNDERVWAALVSVGGSVFSGITITKLLGVIVLAFTRSKIFEIYYFRMWFSLVLVAGAHGLIFLPVALSYFGSQGYAMKDLFIDVENHGFSSNRYRVLFQESDQQESENEDEEDSDIRP
ncbi:sterol-sensing domain of SREBP cleavage-activation-domain-containing protein [Lipomyces oligophaga]|uniref:sterol-sensing domain of SREBP cleavage-activation-domain-containing protein n=1 Tax=Lipomyces oligophaga TaxID=45792 RepID=UPI0034CFA58F